MPLATITRRGALAASLLLFFGCSPSGTSWCYQSQDLADSSSKWERYTYFDEQIRPELELELRRTGPENSWVGYLNSHFRPFPSQDGSTCQLKMTTADELYSTAAPLLEGGHRVQLTEEAMQFLQKAFAQNQEVSVALRPYRSTFPPVEIF